MIHSPEVLAHLEKSIDRSAGPEACHPWLGRLHPRGTPFSYVPWLDQVVAPRRVLFEAHHGVKLATAHRVNSHCPGMRCCNVSHLWGGDLRLRLHTMLDKSGGPDACWPFRGVRLRGYGRIGVRRGERYFAHRVAYELEYGRITKRARHTPEDTLVMHICDNPPCCNPKHLRPGSPKDNIDDMYAKGRAYCQQQHRASRTYGAAQSEGEPR